MDYLYQDRCIFEWKSHGICYKIHCSAANSDGAQGDKEYIIRCCIRVIFIIFFFFFFFFENHLFIYTVRLFKIFNKIKSIRAHGMWQTQEYCSCTTWWGLPNLVFIANNKFVSFYLKIRSTICSFVEKSTHKLCKSSFHNYTEQTNLSGCINKWQKLYVPLARKLHCIQCHMRHGKMD